MIAVQQLALRAGAFAVDDVSLTVPTAAYAVLMGRTGCGKSSLLEAICGLKPVTAGRIFLMNRDVTELHPSERGVGYVPQDLSLFPTLNVRDNLGFALEVRRRSRVEVRRRVDELADLLGLGRLLARWPNGLSGGEAQRVALGRALAAAPPVLLLDEPLSALDEDTRAEMVALLLCVQRRTGVTVLHVTHSRSEAVALADCLFVFDNGSVSQRAVQPTIREVGI